jgi:hypothetical protein
VIASTSITIMLGNGRGQFGPPIVATTTSGFFAVGDFNNDGKADLAVSTTTGLFILLGNGNGTFQPPVQVPGVTGPGALAAGDFNHDGKLDLAVAIIQHFDPVRKRQRLFPATGKLCHRRRSLLGGCGPLQ